MCCLKQQFVKTHDIYIYISKVYPLKSRKDTGTSHPFTFCRPLIKKALFLAFDST